MNNKKIFIKFLLLAIVFSLTALLVFIPTRNTYAEGDTDKAEYLLDEDFSFLSINDPNNIIASGWDVRRAGGAISYGFNSWFKISDTSNVLPVSMNRKFRSQSAGAVTLEYRFRMPTIVNGVKWQLRGDGVEGVSLRMNNGSLELETPDTCVTLQTIQADVEYGVKVEADIDGKKVRVYVNGVLKAEDKDFTNAVEFLDNFLISTGDVTTGEVFFAPVKIYKGYTVNEKFIATVSGPLPSDWSSQLSGGVMAVENMSNAKSPDVFSLNIDTANAAGDMSMEKSIPSQAGSMIFEYKVFFPVKVDGFSAELKQGNTVAFQWSTEDGKFCYRNSSGQSVAFYDYIQNLWYDCKIKLDTVNAKADLYLNGKLVKSGVDLSASSVDSIKFSLTAQNKGRLSLDDILLYQINAEPQDYVPTPVKVNSEGTLVGIQTCSMWREGQHLGWDRINPYPERIPLQGFYDEGNPEEADWEIKWMAEHGIDFQMFCWYRPMGSEGKPIKDPRMGAALHEGYFNAKYSDQVDFMIQWENVSSKASNSSDFRNNIVPYWVEYYFKDPRYLVIDNKPVIAIYSYSGLKRDFGTAEGVKAEIEYLRNACKSAGFDDAIILNSYSNTDPAVMSEMKTVGLDDVFAYSWGQYAGKEALQKSRLKLQRDAGSIGVIPVVSMGRDDSAWGGVSGYYATVGEFQSTAQWVKDTFMPSLPEGSTGQKMVLLDNWNEYGEGHFIMPTGLNGFGYLDAIRNVFAGGGGHTDVIPTQEQKDRIGVLYPAGRVIPPKNVTAPPITDAYTKVWDFNTNGYNQGWTVAKQVSDVTIADGYYSGTSTGNDPGLFSPDSLGISADENPYIHIRMKNNANDTVGRVFFITEKDANWNEAKGVGFFVNPNDSEYTDYYVPMWSNKNWTGKIRAVRFDPITATGSFSIDFIGLVYSPNPVIALYLDGQRTKTITALETIGGSVMVPMSEILGKIGVPTEWDDGNALVAEKDGSVIRIVPGQLTAYKGGAAVTLEQAPVIRGNDLLVSSDALNKLFGYNIAWKAEEETLYVTTQAIKILGENLLVDPGMEMSTLQYSGERVTTELNTSEYHSGHQSLKITKGYAYAKIFFPGVENGKSYYYSAWSKLDPASVTAQNLRICLQYYVGTTKKQVVMITGPDMNASSWKQTQGYFTLNETGNVTNLTMYIYTDTPAGIDTYYLDDVEIRPVTYSTDPVVVHASGVSLNKTSMEIAPGMTQRLLATVEPDNAVERRVTWKSDNTGVAVVDVNGAVYVKSEGVANITATTVEGGLTAVCEVLSGERIKNGTEDTNIQLSVADFTYSNVGSKPSKIKIVSLPAHATLKLGSENISVSQEVYADDFSKLIFIPDSNWNGTTFFSWLGNDGVKYSSQPTATIFKISAANDAPVAINSSLTTNAGVEESGTLSARDVDGDNLTYSIVSQGSKGTAVITNASTGTYIYTPNDGVHGSDGFTFKANDGSMDSNIATVSVNIIPSGVADLTNLSVGEGTLTPGFAVNTMDYSVSVGNQVNSLSVAASVYNTKSSVKINNVSVTGSVYGVYSNIISLNVGLNTIPVEVTAQDGTTSKTYTINATRLASSNADLASLVLSGGTLTPGFSASTTAYSVSVGNNVTGITITPTVNDYTSTVRVNGAVVASSSASGNLALTVGDNIIIVEVIAQDGITKKKYTVTITRAQAPSSGTQESDGNTNNNDNTNTDTNTNTSTNTNANTDTTGVEVLVNGKAYTAGTAITNNVDGKTVTTITVDTAKVEQKLAQEGNNVVLTILANNKSDVVVGELNGQIVKSMAAKEAVVEVKTENAIFTLPAAQINIDSVSQQIGAQVPLQDIKVSITIAAPSENTVQVVRDTANKNNYQIVVKPLEFKITCTIGDKTVEVSKFNGYVERMIAIPEGVDPSKITTGIVLNADGTFSHVPTVITLIKGKYYVKINSLTNSTYSVIWSPKTFSDIENHWAKEAINDMGSRLVINGVGNGMFEPDRDITRAEFATIVVKSLGLMRSGAGKTTYDDVAKGDWYYDAISIANEYGIISGYDDGKFGPTDKITREQAMAIIARAMKITGLKVELGKDEAQNLLSVFTDWKESSDWVREYMAACVKTGIISGRNDNMIAPKDSITRAEVAVIVRRLLQKSSLI